MADNIMDYNDKYPGQYEGDQQRYARGMDDYYRKLNMIALREHGKHYEDLDIHNVSQMMLQLKDQNQNKLIKHHHLKRNVKHLQIK